MRDCSLGLVSRRGTHLIAFRRRWTMDIASRQCRDRAKCRIFRRPRLRFISANQNLEGGGGRGGASLTSNFSSSDMMISTVSRESASRSSMKLESIFTCPCFSSCSPTTSITFHVHGLARNEKHKKISLYTTHLSIIHPRVFQTTDTTVTFLIKWLGVQVFKRLLHKHKERHSSIRVNRFNWLPLSNTFRVPRYTFTGAKFP